MLPYKCLVTSQDPFIYYLILCSYILAQPLATYKNEMASRHITFPTPDSVRDIMLSCPIRPGALIEKYSVQWRPMLPDFVTINSTAFDISVKFRPVISSQYRCTVTIDHFNGIVVNYHGPQIAVFTQGEILSVGDTRVGL